MAEDRPRDIEASRGSHGSEASAATAERAATLAWVLLAALAAVHLLLAVVPGTWGWGLAQLRFSPSPAGWALWAIGAALLIPAVGRFTLGFARHAVVSNARASDFRWLVAYVAWALLAAAVVLAFPERLMLWGEILLRVARPENHSSVFATLNPHAFPLDRLVHDRLIHVLARWGEMGGEDARRILGAVEAALLGGLSVHLARAAGLGGAAALAAGAGALWCGVLLLCAGYGQAFGALAVAAFATGVFAIEVVRSGRGLLRMSVGVATGVLLHPLGLTLLIPAGIAAWHLLRGRAAGEPMQRRIFVSAVLVIASLALVTPALLRFVRALGAPAAWSPAALGSPLGMLDLANALLWGAPIVLVLALVPAARIARRAEAVVLAALIVPLLVGALPLLVRGPIRSWDVLAPAVAALALAAAWATGETLRAAPRFAWLAFAIGWSAAAPVVQALARQSSLDEGLRWVEAFVKEPPQRSEPDRAALWDFLGARELDAGLAVEASAAFREAATLAPSARILRQYAMTEIRLGRRAGARDVYRLLLERNPDDASAWVEFATLNAELGDFATAREAAARAWTLRPGWPPAGVLLQQLGVVPTEALAPPDSTARAAAPAPPAARVTAPPVQPTRTPPVTRPPVTSPPDTTPHAPAPRDTAPADTVR